jgi:hypothetical protein
LPRRPQLKLLEPFFVFAANFGEPVAVRERHAVPRRMEGCALPETPESRTCRCR